jgi:hypothetical protein
MRWNRLSYLLSFFYEIKCLLMDNVYEKDYICCQYLTNDLPHPNSENYE